MTLTSRAAASRAAAPSAPGAGDFASGPGARPDASGRRERNKADKQARILAAAQSLLGEVGYERMTTAEVAKRAQVAAGTVFQYAPTKPELLMMVVEHAWQDTVARQVPDEMAGQGVEGDVIRLLAPLAQETRRFPENAMVVGRELLFGVPGPYRQKVLELVGELEQAITARLVEAGGDPARSGVAASLIVSGGMLELNRTRTGRADEDSVMQRLRALVEVAVRGAGAVQD